MSRLSNQRSNTSNELPLQTIMLGAIAWGVLALFFYLLFGVRSEGEARPDWYSVGTYVFENVAFAAAGVLCFRNWQSRQMVSGRNVWLFVGLGMFSFFMGNLFFGVWELVFKLSPEGSLGDVFYLLTYLFLAIGMILAVIPRRLNMESWQWLAVGGLVAVSVVVTYGVVSYSDNNAYEDAAEAAADLISTQTAPGWAIQFSELLLDYIDQINLLYILGDIALLAAAATLIMAFWGGRFAQSWRMIAAATVCLYLADMYFYYAVSVYEDYQSGEIPEVFWVFSGVLFAVGAALEYDISNRSSRRGSRRRN